MLEGSLVRLRPLEPGDRDRYYEWLNDNEVKEFLASRYFFSRLAEENYLAERAGKPLSFEGATFAIDTLDGRHIGSVSLEHAAADDRKATLGIVIGDKDFWSHGYGTDAITTLLRFGFDEMNLHRVQLHVDERNARAIACYKKCGFLDEGRLREDRFARGHYWDTVVMSVLDREFRALHGAPDGP